MRTMRYDGFISYSHAADGQLAPALQKALQRLAKPWFRRRSLEIFRDETGLSVDPHLWGAIVKALDDSEWFVLLTSPLAAQSEWVNREIEHWKAHRSVDRILPVVTDGHWQWDEATGDFTGDSDAVPPALHGVFGDEPRHLDLRWAHDEKQLDLNNGRFRNAVAEVAAPLHGRSKDEIEGEDVRQHRRTVRTAWSAAATLAVLTVAALVAGGVAVVNAHKAEQRRIQAESQRLANYSQDEPAVSDLAFLLGAQSYRQNANPLTESAVFRAVTSVPPEVKQTVQTGSPVTAVALSGAADRVWAITAQGDLVAYRYSDGGQVARMQGVFRHQRVFRNGVVAMATIGDDEVVATDGVVTATFDGELKPSMKRSAPGALMSLAADPSTGRVAGGAVDGRVFVWEPKRPMPSATLVTVPDIPGNEFVGVPALAWAPDGSLIVASGDGGLSRYDIGAPDQPVWHERLQAKTVAVLPDGTLITGGPDGMVEFRVATTGLPTTAGSRKLPVGEINSVVSTGDTPENGSVAAVGGDGVLVFLNHLTGERVLAPVQVGESATSVAWDLANPLHGVVGWRGGVTLLDYNTTGLPATADIVAGWSDVASVATNRAGDRLAVVRTQKSGNTFVSDLVLTSPTQPDPNGPSVRFEGVVNQLIFTPDGSRVLASTEAGTVAVWDGNAADATVSSVARGEPVTQLAVSPDGSTVATGSISLDINSKKNAPIRLWRFDGLNLVQTRQTDHTTFGYGLAFSPDGTRLVIGGVNELAFYPLDGGTSVTVKLVDDSIRSLAVSPDGKTVAVGLFGGSVRFYDMQTGAPTGDELRQPEPAAAVAFRDGNEALATVSREGRFNLWDLANLRSFSGETTPYDPNVRPISSSLALGPDFAFTASAADKRLVKWSLDPDDWIDKGCKQHARDLTDSEKARFDMAGSSPVCPAG